MTLGEKIATLRNQHGFSQGDLAEKVNVSRQSISKWETDTSIPELDKLIQLSEVFHITLDELVKSETAPESVNPKSRSDEAAASPQVVIQKTGSTRAIIAVILLCFGALILALLTALGGFLGGLLFASPFLLCGAACLIFKKNIGLWCAWAIVLPINLYLRRATALTWRLTLLTLHFNSNMNYTRLAFAWIELLCFVILIVITIQRFRKLPLVLNRRSACLYIAGWIAFALVFIPLPLNPYSELATLYHISLDWIKVALFTPLATTTLRLIRTHMLSKSNKETR